MRVTLLFAIVVIEADAKDFCCYYPKAKQLSNCDDCSEKATHIDGQADCESDKDNTWCPADSPSPSPTPTPSPSPSGSCPDGWKEATWTGYESWPRCCKGNDNYDPKAPTDECTEDNGCKWAGQFAYHQCDGKDVCPLDWVKNTNIVSFFTTNGEHKHYKDKHIRVQARGQIAEVQVTDTCGDSDCDGCCTKNAKKHGGSLIDMEFYTIARYWPDIKEPEENLFELICWQPIAQSELV